MVRIWGRFIRFRDYLLEAGPFNLGDSCDFSLYIIWGFPARHGAIPHKMLGLLDWESQSKMDDDWGYPLRTPSYDYINSSLHPIANHMGFSTVVRL